MRVVVEETDGAGILIARSVFFRTVFFSKEYVKGYGLDEYSGLSVARVVETYRLVFYGLLVQEEGFSNTQLIGSSEYVVFKQPKTEFCRWHSSPLGVEDDPLRREYCVEKPISRLGYCQVHKESLRALYSSCFESRSLEGSSSCERLDRLQKDSVEYLVYLLAYSVDGFKVGSTRRWRMLQRIAEQPHVVATTLYVSRSAVDTRRVETRAGMLDWLTENPHRDVHKTIATPLKAVLNRLVGLREKTLKTLGLEALELDMVRVMPSTDLEIFSRAKVVDLDRVLERRVELYGFGYGYLVLSDVTSSDYFLLRIGEVFHKDCLRLVK